MSAKKTKDAGSKINVFRDLKKETVQGVVAIIFFVLAVLAILAAFGKAGKAGAWTYSLLEGKLLGVGYFLLPLLLVTLGISYFKSLEHRFETVKVVGAVIFFVSGLGLIELAKSGAAGVLGYWIAYVPLKAVDLYASLILFVALLVISALIAFDAQIKTEHILFWRKFMKPKEAKDKEKALKASEAKIAEPEEPDEDEEPETEEEPAEEPSEEEEAAKPKEEKKPAKKGLLTFGKEEEKGLGITAHAILTNKEFVPPPLSLLERDKGKAETGDIKANANIIKRTLSNFGISVEMDEISIGPSVTRYALKPAEGVKLSKIVGLNNDLALALAAHPIRIEAPIPGKSLVGIEIPNSTKTTVGLNTLLGSDEYQSSEKPLLISLGKSITGKSHFANLAKAPHMLIAGATGSGKSVTIHAIITSLLFRNSPENLKLIMIDPKRVELTLYNKIPHLLTPVITEAKKAILALKWAAKEMDRRYDLLESHTVRDIESYHKNVLAPTIKRMKDAQAAGETVTEEMPETMPYIVIVIDELADIMQTYPRELEAAIVRLAQMSRAVGIHLMLSTQRPSVNVITGLIKANVPTRVALQVSSQIDSRTILDTSGAEKLLGAGDMLYLGAEMAKPVRLQSAYITEAELKKVVKYLQDTYKDEIQANIDLAASEGNGGNSIFSADLESDGEEDDMYEQAREAVIEAGKASTSYIQRKLRVGYARAARLMDMLEERGVIGPADGAKPREVIDGSRSESHGEAGDPTQF